MKVFAYIGAAVGTVVDKVAIDLPLYLGKKAIQQTTAAGKVAVEQTKAAGKAVSNKIGTVLDNAAYESAVKAMTKAVKAEREAADRAEAEDRVLRQRHNTKKVGIFSVA